jgi:hypothetical protein
MAVVGGAQGVELRSYVQAALPCRGKVIQAGPGTACFYADPGLGQQWVQLLVLNRRDLSLVSNSSLHCPLASTKGEKAFDSGNSCTDDLAETINGLTDADLVFAVNQPGTSADRLVQPPVGLGAVLSGKVTSGGHDSNLGIEATAWFDAAQKGKWGPYAVRGTFSAIGVPHWTSHGVWAMPAQPNQGGKGALAANIAVDNDAFYSPVVPGSSADVKNSPVTGVLTQAPTAWPSASSGEKAAMSAIGTKVGLGSNPRAQYYSSLNQEVDWLRAQDAVNGLKYSDVSSKKFDAQDFEAAQQELSREIGYVIDVEKYVGELAMPYQGASTTLWSSFIKVWQDVNAATSNGQTATVFGIIGDVLQDALIIAPVFGTAATVATTIAMASYDVASGFASLGSGSSQASFGADAASYGQQLAVRLDATETEILDRWRNIIVSDYGKLKTVSDCASGRPACRLQPTKWMFSLDQETRMETTLKLALERELYTALVPAKYSLRLALGGGTRENPNSLSEAQDLKQFCTPLPPFDNRTGSWIFQYYNTYGVQILTNRPKDVLGKWEAASSGVFSRMFSKIDPGGDFTKGGLGIDEPPFMTKYWPTSDDNQDSGRYSTSQVVNTPDNDLYPINICQWPHRGSSAEASHQANG